jgi:hypothetical protein
MAHRAVGSMAGTRQVTGAEDGEIDFQGRMYYSIAGEEYGCTL